MPGQNMNQMDMEKSRVHFEKLVKAYMEYRTLYKCFNGGRSGGEVAFAVFYWNHHFIYRHKLRRWSG
jgi:hypothetical protein